VPAAARWFGTLRANPIPLAGAVGSLAVALVLFTRFSIYDSISRDEGIYAYGGQRMVHGVPPYSSIFDPKTPVATLLSGVGAWLGHLIGRNELTCIRLTFFLVALATVVSLYLLALRLWGSVVGAFVAAVVFCSFNVYAADALGGPGAKAPGILGAVLTMLFVVERRWYWAGFASMVAVMTWQPLVIFPVMVLVITAVDVRASREWKQLYRALAGLATPLVAIIAYFAATDGLGHFWEAAFWFPATGIHKHYSFITQVKTIHHVVVSAYHFSAYLLLIGDLALVAVVVAFLVRRRDNLRAALRDPLVSIVFVTMIFELGYALYDFQGPPDVYPFLPYPALGFAALVALGSRRLATPEARRSAAAAVLAAAMVVVGFSFVWFKNSNRHDEGLHNQQADGCALDRLLSPNRRLYVLGDPVPLVITRRVNPDRFIYLEEQVDRWKIDHTPGGFAGWTQQIAAHDPAVIILQGWKHGYAVTMKSWIRSQGYQSRFLGKWHVYVRPGIFAVAQGAGVRLTPGPTAYATGLDGHKLTSGCTSASTAATTTSDAADRVLPGLG
jgi:hypothetical protein